MVKRKTGAGNAPRQNIPFLSTWAALILRVSVLGLGCAYSGLLHGQTIPAGDARIPLVVQLPRHTPMRVGQVLDGRLLYPVYIENRLVIPQGSTLRGSVVGLESDRSRRIHARLRGDFTPYRTPVVHFENLLLPDGQEQSLTSRPTKGGVVILHLSAPAAGGKRSFLAQQFALAKQQAKEKIALFTTPGRGDRLLQFVYGQLPYHPQRIEEGTTWNIELSKPLALADLPASAPVPVPAAKPATKPARSKEPSASPASEEGAEWSIRAYLQQTISSADRKAGDSFEALVAEPVFGANHALLVPEGSLLMGEVTQSKRARSFGRQGKLRFRFRELRLPAGFTQPVEGTLASIDAGKAADLQVDAEGGIQPKSRNRVIAPLALGLLAGRALDEDGSQQLNSAVAANGFGLIGRVVGIASGSRGVAVGIGAYGAALSFYDQWLAHGHDIVFGRNTRIEITTRPGRTLLGNTTGPKVP